MAEMTPLEAAPNDLSGARILVVDDNGMSRRNLRLSVENLGHVAEMVADGHEALDALRDGSFDAVLLDILMPGLEDFGGLGQPFDAAEVFAFLIANTSAAS